MRREATKQIRARVESLLAQLADLTTPRPRDTWTEDDGDVLWWTLPIKEPPYVGSPLDDDDPGHATHWTPLPVAKETGT